MLWFHLNAPFDCVSEDIEIYDYELNKGLRWSFFGYEVNIYSLCWRYSRMQR